MKIAIQGRLGSFHDIAAHDYFGKDTEALCCATFEEVCREVAEGRAQGLVAIENTIAGSLLHNYELLRESGTVVTGEYKLHIEHSICCLPDDDWDTLTEVHSHPVALMQCRHYLERHPGMKIVEAEDTAGSAEQIAKEGRRGWAAICHVSAARQWGLKVLEEKIEDNKHNFTRFLAVEAPKNTSDKEDVASKANKSSLVFALPHSEGALSKVLTILSFYDMNLTKIQSLPIIGREWEYLFYVDVTFADVQRFHQSIDAIVPLTKELKILGIYKEW